MERTLLAGSCIEKEQLKAFSSRSGATVALDPKFAVAFSSLVGDGQQPIQLANTHFTVLESLLKHPDSIVRFVCPNPYMVVHNLRNKLGDRRIRGTQPPTYHIIQAHADGYSLSQSDQLDGRIVNIPVVKPDRSLGKPQFWNQSGPLLLIFRTGLDSHNPNLDPYPKDDQDDDQVLGDQWQFAKENNLPGDLLKTGLVTPEELEAIEYHLLKIPGLSPKQRRAARLPEGLLDRFSIAFARVS